MKKKFKHFSYATATLLGYVIGAGIFGLPYVMQKLGFLPAAFLLLILLLTTVINCLSLAEIILRTPGKHYFPGLAKIYLGRTGQRVQFFSTLIGDFGSILAYMLLGGLFLENIFGFFSHNIFVFSLAFIILGALIILKSYEELGIAEIFMSVILLGIIFAMSIFGFDKINSQNYFNFDSVYLLPALGVLLFALDGSGGIITVRNILLKRENLLKRTIITTYVTVFFVFFIFSATIVGIYGESVSPESVFEMGEILGGTIKIGASLFGFLAVFSSFIVIGSNLKNTFQADLKIPRFISWVLVWSVPLILYLLGFQNFIAVISLVGIVFGTVGSLMIALMLRNSRIKGKRKPEFKLRLPLFVNYFIVFLYLTGMCYEMVLFCLRR